MTYLFYHQLLYLLLRHILLSTTPQARLLNCNGVRVRLNCVYNRTGAVRLETWNSSRQIESTNFLYWWSGVWCETTSFLICNVIQESMDVWHNVSSYIWQILKVRVGYFGPTLAHWWNTNINQCKATGQRFHTFWDGNNVKLLYIFNELKF